MKKTNLKEGSYYKLLWKKPIRFKIEKEQGDNYVIKILDDKGKIRDMPFMRDIFNKLIKKKELEELSDDEAVLYEL